jgi:outer membrane lipoprotein-sorting protein
MICFHYPYMRFGLFALALSLTADYAACSETTSAAQVIKGMIANYESYETYRDRGKITVNHYASGTVSSYAKSHFATYFERPGKFRFEWVDDTPIITPLFSIVWRDSSGAYVYSGEGRLKRKETLNSALSAVAGKSAGASYIVPKYLLHEVPCGPPSTANAVQLSERVAEDGKKYYIMRFVYADDLSEKLWIEPESLLVRRVERWSVRKAGEVETIIDYEEVEVDKSIDDSVFDVPEGANGR